MNAARGPDAVAEARARRDRLDGWLRAFVATYDGDGPGTVHTGSWPAHEVGSRAGPCGPGTHEAPAGLPVAVKGTRGIRTPAVRRLLAAGAVPIGATSVPRGAGHQTWGWTDRGPTRNPWRADRSPGGSSAGSAAAVAAGIVPLATGSDGAGSVRIPAAWCGVLGYKPTTGLVPGTDPTGLATPGILVRDPALLLVWLAAVTDAVGTHAPGPGNHPTTAPRGPARHPTDPGQRRTEPGCRCAELGCRCADPEPGWTGPGTAAWSPDLGFAGADLDPAVVAIARSAARRWVSRTGLDEIEVPVRLRDPAPAWAALRRPGASAASLRAANALLRANDRALRELFERVVLLLTPATPAGPHGHDGPGGRMNVALTWTFNLSGHPAVSVPAGFGPDGCPVGLQIVARPGEDHRLLTLLERRQPVAGVAVPR